MDWVQLHLALNHVPVIGTPILVVMLLVGWLRRREETVRFVLWSLLWLTVAAIAIKFTGDFAVEQSPEKFLAVKELVELHEQSADQSTTGVFLLSISVGLALFLGRAKRSIRPWTIILVLFLGLCTIGLYLRSAHTGGQISHPELREGQSNPT